MPGPEAIPAASLLASRTVTVPQHVVFRSFPTETVVLNLQTGRYHGLNPTAGRMLDVLARSASVREAAAVVAAEFDRPQQETEADICNLCSALLERGLLELDAGTDR